MTEQRGLLGRVTGAVTGRVVETIDPDAVLEQIDLDALLDRVDLNRVLDRIDVDGLVDRVDLDRLLARVDLDALLDRVDVERLLARIDVEALVRRSGVPELVAESTGQVAGSALDVARRQLVGLDTLLGRLVDRLLRRTPSARAVALTTAGAVSRSAAAVVDILVITASYAVGYAGVDLLLHAFLGRTLGGDRSGPVALAALTGWTFLYVFGCLAVAGRTPGRGLVGLRVVGSDRRPLTVRAALVRTLVQPLSSLLLGLGYLPVLLQREHRALHDLVARTLVVYDWGDRAARLPGPLDEFLARREARTR